MITAIPADRREPDNVYQFNCGQYVYFRDGEPVTKPADTIALFIDKADGTLHKHGDPVAVRKHHQTTCGAYRASDSPEVNALADDLIVVEGRFPLEEINRCLSITFYAKRFYEKLVDGQIAQALFNPDGEPEADADTNVALPGNAQN